MRATLTDDDRRQRWFKALYLGDASELARMIAAGAEVGLCDSLGSSGVLVAAEYGKAECLRLLIAAGADVDAKNVVGASPALVAAANGQAECLALLLAAGGDIGEPPVVACGACAELVERELARRAAMAESAELSGALGSAARSKPRSL